MESKSKSGMQVIIDGFLKYKKSDERAKLIEEMKMVSDHPDPHSIIMSCVDSRIVLSRVTQTATGETFITRNPGNILPDYNILNPKTPKAEEAALELAFLHNDIDTLVICGHSDCKAMNLVYANRNNLTQVEDDGEESVLKSWLMSNSGPTIKNFLELKESNFKKPLTIQLTELNTFQAYIDLDDSYAENDKLSQINTLTQLGNLKKYKFIRELLENYKLQAFAFWLDIYCGDVYCFSYVKKRFIKLNEETYEHLLEQSIHLVSS
jgi:carbonic anhydrase